MTVRQAFYQAEVKGLVEKEETGYDKVQRVLLKLRKKEGCLTPGLATFAYKAAQEITEHFWQGKRTYVYYLGDWDPSGVQAAEDLEKKLREHSPLGSSWFQRLALFPSQVYGTPKLPTRDIKDKDTRAQNFRRKFGVNECTELDALPPDELRFLVRDAIESHLPDGYIEDIKFAEEEERRLFARIMEDIKGTLPKDHIAYWYGFSDEE
jgi:hypothetical protein